MINKNNTENPILTEPIMKQLLLFFFPILFGSLFQQFYNTCDAVIVGRYVGADALAAVGGSAGLIVNLVVGFFTGLAAGACVIISQSYGAEKYNEVSTAIHTAYAFSIAGGLLLTVIGIVFSPSILRMMNQPEEIMAESVLYLRIYFAGMLAIFIFNIASGIFRALGNSRLPLVYLVISSVINILLDLLFIIVLHMGVMGAATATLIAQVVSAVLITVSLTKLEARYCLRLNKIRINWEYMKKEFALGIPGGLQSVMYSISNMLVQASVNVFGTMTIAGWTADSKLESFFWVTNGAIGAAVTTFVGQNYGAGKKDRVIRGGLSGILCHIVFSSMFAVVFSLFAVPLLEIFTSDAEAILVGKTILCTVTPFYFLFSFVEIITACLRGVGDVLYPTILTLLSICIFRILWILIYLPMRPQISTIIILYPITWGVCAGVFLIYLYVRGYRLLTGEKKA